MPAIEATVRKTAFYTPGDWAKLRARLYKEHKTYAEWAREQLDAYLAGQ